MQTEEAVQTPDLLHLINQGPGSPDEESQDRQENGNPILPKNPAIIAARAEVTGYKADPLQTEEKGK